MMITAASLHNAVLWLQQGDTTGLPSMDYDIFCNMLLIQPTLTFVTKYWIHNIVSCYYVASVRTDRRSFEGKQTLGFGQLHISTKVKGEVVPVHVMNAYRVSRGTAPLVLKLGTRCRWVVSFTPRPGKKKFSIHWTQGWVGSGTGLDILETRKIPSLCRESSPGFSRPQSNHYTNWAILAPKFIKIECFVN